MTFPDFDPVLVHLGPIAIRWYALAYVAGILAGWRYGVSLTRNAALWRGRRVTASAVQVDDFVLWLTIGLIAGGRLGYVLFYDAKVLVTDPLEVFKPWHGGMSFHGGMIGVTLAILGFALRNRLDVLRLGDLTAPCVPFGLFFGRLANFINGELWGRPTSAPWGMVFCNPRLQALGPNGACAAGTLPRHPSQLYEAGLEGIVLFLILRLATHRAGWLPRRGAITGLFLTGYGVFRIALEHVREPDVGMPDFPFGLTMGMILSIPMVLAGLALIAWSRRPEALAPPAPAESTGEAVGAPVDAPPETGTDLSQTLASGAAESTIEANELRARLEARIAAEGPITVADYVTACLLDPQFGYYATRPRLGAEGDFITAPLVSQMFGELIGLWAVEVWTRLGRPAPFRLVEVGPGDGTLMSDVLRAARVVPAFLEAADTWLVEPSPPLRGLQAERLGPDAVRWADGLDEVQAGAPVILIANEVLDCLPARQFLRTEAGWAERRIGLVDGALGFGFAQPPADFAPPRGLERAPIGAVVELSPAQEAFGLALGERIAAEGGCALLIDYGRDRPETGDTLQALRRHEKVDPLACPGEADVTVHADFPAVARAATQAGAEVTQILNQADFLHTLGIAERAAVLQRARPDRAEVVSRQLARLVGDGEMGQLFKAVAIHGAGLRVPGFEETVS